MSCQKGQANSPQQPDRYIMSQAVKKEAAAAAEVGRQARDQQHCRCTDTQTQPRAGARTWPTKFKIDPAAKQPMPKGVTLTEMLGEGWPGPCTGLRVFARTRGPRCLVYNQKYSFWNLLWSIKLP